MVRWLRVRWGGGWEVRVKLDRSGGVGLLVVRGPRGEKESFAAFEEFSRGCWNGTAPKFLRDRTWQLPTPVFNKVKRTIDLLLETIHVTHRDHFYWRYDVLMSSTGRYDVKYGLT